MKTPFRKIFIEKLENCQDLRANITLVGYRQFSPIHGHWGFSTDADFDKNFDKNIAHKCNDSYKAEVEKVAMGIQDLFVRVGKPNEKVDFLNGLYNLGVWNTICLYSKKNENIEGFYFCTKSTEDAAYLINTREYIENLREYFDMDFDVSNISDVPYDGHFDWRSAS